LSSTTVPSSSLDSSIRIVRPWILLDNHSCLSNIRYTGKELVIIQKGGGISLLRNMTSC
jgi:hypothetical protein